MSSRVARVRWVLAAAVAALVTAGPVFFYRLVYVHSKRLREVSPGRVYRGGQMTAGGFTDAVARFGIKTIVNFQDEYPDPDISLNYFGTRTIKESELCRRLGVRYVFLRPDLIPRRRVPEHRPRAIERFLALLDDPSTYPVLLHCRAGLHRTGVMVADYRMEYEGWTPQQALQELRANGFGQWASSSANDYITQYILTYRPGIRVSDEDGRDP